MSRFRVALNTVKGRTWFDVSTQSEAIRRAQAEKKAGARNVVVLEERPWPESQRHYEHHAANFVQVWP